MTALNEQLFSAPVTPLQQEVLSVISEYRDFYYPHRSLQNEDQLRVVRTCITVYPVMGLL